MASARKPVPLRPLATYEGDYYSWLIEQAHLLDTGQAERADVEHIAEALRDLGNEQLHRLEGALRVLLTHLLKWDHQPSRRGASWRTSILNSRDTIRDLFADSPGLKPRRGLAIERAYRKARREAASETGLDESRFPPDCPYDFDAMMGREVPWPPI